MGRMNSLNVENQVALLNLPFAGETEGIVKSSFKETISWFAYPGQDPEIIKLTEVVTQLGCSFLSKFYLNSSLIRPEGLADFEKACKTRYGDLVSLLAKLSELDENYDVLLAFGESMHLNPSYFTKKGTVLAISLEDEELDKLVYEVSTPPKWFSPLFVGILRCMDLAVKLKVESQSGYYAAREIALVLMSLGKMYAEFRSTPKMKMKQGKEIFHSLQSPHILDKDDEFYKIFQIVKRDIIGGKLPYIREMHSSIYGNEAFIKSPYAEEDYYYSGKGTSSSINNKSDKSLHASMYEIDPFAGMDIDGSILYESAYNKIKIPGYFDYLVKTIGIDQHKIKMRMIHIFGNAAQDRGRYCERRLLRILSSLPNDATKDQRLGVQFLMKITLPSTRKGKGWPSVNAIDYSNMTDLLSQEFQSECLRIIPFREGVHDFLDHIMTLEKTFFFADGTKKRYKQTCGQPQGFLASFASFTFAHHILRLIIMYKAGLQKYRASECYALLGDDNASTSIIPDPNENFERIIKEASIWVNLSINLDKSKFVKTNEQSATLDFASVTVVNGEMASPPPIRILSRVDSKSANYHSFTTALWMSQTGYHLPFVFDHLIKKWYGGDETFFKGAQILMYGGIIPSFSSFYKSNEYLEIDRAKLALCYLVTKIRGTFLECFLNDRDRENLTANNYRLDDAIALLLPEAKSHLFDLIENPEHKFLKAMKRNLIIEDSMKSILGYSNPGMYLPVLGELSESEISAIFSIANLVTAYREGILDDVSLLTVLKDSDTLVKLDRFHMRSLYKRQAREFYYMREALLLYRDSFIDPVDNND